MKPRQAEEVNLNLIPIMNLFTALIPFLLMSAVFYKLSVIPVSVPVASSSGETDVAKETDSVTLNLQVKEDAFVISASNEALLPKKLDRYKKNIARKGNDKKALAELSLGAYAIKSAFAQSKDAIVVPEAKVEYDDVIQAIDAVRKYKKDEQSVPEIMFTKVVISSRIQ